MELDELEDDELDELELEEELEDDEELLLDDEPEEDEEDELLEDDEDELDDELLDDPSSLELLPQAASSRAQTATPSDLYIRLPYLFFANDNFCG